MNAVYVGNYKRNKLLLCRIVVAITVKRKQAFPKHCENPSKNK